MGKQYKVTFLRPAGNDTALVQGLVNPKLKKRINDLILKRYSAIEQVGFYDTEKKILEMAGGEFCGNATRSFAFLLLKNKKEKIVVNVSGVATPLKCGIKKYGRAYAQMPILNSSDSVVRLDDNITKVTLQGITHVIIPTKINDYPIEELKEQGKNILKTYNLLSTVSASGALFIQGDKNVINMQPIIWVKQIKTLFYETACASGSTAIALANSLRYSSKKYQLSIKQPSGLNLEVIITKTSNKFLSAYIDGPIQILGKENITV